MRSPFLHVVRGRRLAAAACVLYVLLLAFVSATRAAIDRVAKPQALVRMNVRQLHRERARPAHTLAFFRVHRWLLAPRHATCWTHVPWARSCNVGRLANRAARVRVATIDWHLQRRALRARRRLVVSSSDMGAWLCIHRGEGSWSSNTGNGYYGGLQMDAGFQSTYGGEFVARWGTADRWPVWAQIVAARRARDSGRGYSPWPNTARACGLL